MSYASDRGFLVIVQMMESAVPGSGQPLIRRRVLRLGDSVPARKGDKALEILWVDGGGTIAARTEGEFVISEMVVC